MRKSQLAIAALSLAALFSAFAGGCAIGTTRVCVAHEMLQKVEPKRQGSLLIKTVVDGRAAGHREFIGNKRNAYGMVLGHIGTIEGVRLEDVMTKSLAEALGEAGYSVTIASAGAPVSSDSRQFDAVIEGRITEFWLDLYMMVWHDVKMQVSIQEPGSGRALWNREFHGTQTNVLWLGITPEFEKAIAQAMTKMLDSVAKTAASDECYQCIKRK